MWTGKDTFDNPKREAFNKKSFNFFNFRGGGKKFQKIKFLNDMFKNHSESF